MVKQYTKEDVVEMLKGIGNEATDEMFSTIDEDDFILAIPIREGEQDRLCRKCLNYIDHDFLNDDIKTVPTHCSNCGIEFDWSEEYE